MAEAVAGAVVATGSEVLFELLLSSQEFRLKHVPKLEEKLQKVKVFLDDAENKQLSNKDVKEWLDDFKHVFYMADDLIEMINNSKKKKGAASWIISYFRSFVKKGKNRSILQKLDGLYDRARDLELKSICSSADPNRRSSPTIAVPLLEDHHVYGRKAEKEEILSMLNLSEEDKMIVLSIFGMAGLGKTTLAQLVYSDKQVEEHGFLQAWVTISPEFDFCRILKILLQTVNPGTSCSEGDDTNKLQRLLKEALRGKRLLFVLDNVSDVSYSNWDLLKNIFTAADRSRGIVTTRSRVVGYMVTTGPIHQLKEVQKDYCSSIFAQHAFNGNTNPDPRLQEIGGRIVEKCQGLPLAIRCIAGHLCSERNPQKWENFLRRDLGYWSKVMVEEVFPTFWLSYCNLSSPLKQCFAYCSLFPKGYKFYEKEIVLLWMAEGFLQEGKSMEDTGRKYFDDLVSRSLFQRSSEDDDKYVVHDLFHDLAAFVCSNFYWRTGDDSENVTVRTRHLTYNEDVSFDELLDWLSKSKHLRTLMNIPASEHQLSFNILKKMAEKVRRLRVLTICLPSPVFCKSLGDLKMLRYLNLSGSEIEKLPDSVCSLSNLQTLILLRCYQITQLPTDLPEKLRNLRYLNTISTGLTKMPPKMGSLKELRTLACFVLGRGDGSGCSRLKELGELHHLIGLFISELQNVDCLEDVKNANLIGKEGMKKLCLRWGIYDGGNNIQAADVLDELRPHQNLEKLEVYNYPGSSFPKWVGDCSFLRLDSVRLNGTFNDSCQLLPPLGQLPFLRELCIESFEGVTKIGDEFLYGNDASSSNTPFPSLEELSFQEMERWEDWSFLRNESGRFPCLRILKFSVCPTLEFIIRENDFPKLEQLRISHSPLLERSYQKDRGEHWGYISHIPNIHISGDTTRQLEWEEEQTRLRAESSGT